MIGALARVYRYTRILSSILFVFGVMESGAGLFALPGPAAGTGTTPGGRSGLAAPRPMTSRLVELPRLPVHLWQWNPMPGAFYSPMGCGAFTTAMALSVYDPDRFGSYAGARALYEQMGQIPLIGGTWEGQNAAASRGNGFVASMFDHGTLPDLRSAIDRGAPVILAVEPTVFGAGLHDVLLIGYALDSHGALTRVYVDNPAMAAGDGADPQSPAAPGNQLITLGDLMQSWTGVFTPVFRSPAGEQTWRAAAGR